MNPRTIIFYDTEYTTWKGAMENGWSLPGQHKDIVQVAALRFNLDTMTSMDEISLMSFPDRNPVLSDYFIDLTGIDNAQLTRDGMPFPQMMTQLRAFIRDAPAISHGGDDVIVNENLLYHGLPADFTGLDIRPWFHLHGAPYGIRAGVNSGKLAEMLGLKTDDLQEHNALHDVRSIAAAYAFLIDKGAAAFI